MTFDDILNTVVPGDPIQRIHAFARDLAAGVGLGLWDASYKTKNGWSRIGTTAEYETLLSRKWGNLPPHPINLVAFGYLLWQEKNPEHNESITTFILTPKTFDLLLRPATSPNIFISYRRRPHAALALLVEARLKMVGAVPFLDKDLVNSPNEWHGKLEAQIKDSQYLIALIGENAFDEGSFTVQELAWAREAGVAIIPVLDNLTVEESKSRGAPDEAYWPDAILIQGHRALDYETGISHILNKLGYATY